MDVRHSTVTIGSAIALLILTGCSSGPPVVPTDLKSQIDSSVSFPQILESPHSYSGRTVLLGGEILSTKRVQDGTQLEILQLPVTDSDPPAERRTESQGRFLALNRSQPDPASLPAGTRVTLVGEVTGEATQRLDESTYRYPTVDVKHLYVWDESAYRDRERSPVGVGVGVGVFGGSGGRGGFGGVGIGTGY
ncbi:MAG TPA: Slp family lipoprotein [Nitrospiraceae bacterium]